MLDFGLGTPLSLDALHTPVYRIIDPTVRWMVKRGVHPNLVTTLRP